jgi:antitoxin component of MazEF toxin-antitoxin module
MLTKLEIIEIGDELGVILPEEILASLGVREGDEIVAEIVPGGCLLKATSKGATQNRPFSPS